MILIYRRGAYFAVHIIGIPFALADSVVVVARHGDILVRIIGRALAVGLPRHIVLFQADAAVEVIGPEHAIAPVVQVAALLQKNAFRGVSLPETVALPDAVVLHLDEHIAVGIVAPFAVFLLVNVSALGSFLPVLMEDDRVNLVNPLFKIGGTLQLPVGVVVFERAVGDIVLELTLVNELSLLILLPHALLLPVLVGHIGLRLREHHRRQD